MSDNLPPNVLKLFQPPKPADAHLGHLPPETMVACPHCASTLMHVRFVPVRSMLEISCPGCQRLMLGVQMAPTGMPTPPPPRPAA